MNWLDLATFRWVNRIGLHSDPLYLAYWLITHYDFVIFTGLFLWYLLFHRQDIGRMRRTILLALLAGLLAFMGAGMLGELIRRPRPFEVLPMNEVYVFLPQNRDSSLPSEFAAVAIAFAVAMWRAPGKTARWVFSALTVFVGISQVGVGFHWPSDILASGILGGLSVRVLDWLSTRLALVLSSITRVFERLVRHRRI